MPRFDALVAEWSKTPGSSLPWVLVLKPCACYASVLLVNSQRKILERPLQFVGEEQARCSGANADYIDMPSMMYRFFQSLVFYTLSLVYGGHPVNCSALQCKNGAMSDYSHLIKKSSFEALKMTVFLVGRIQESELRVLHVKLSYLLHCFH